MTTSKSSHATQSNKSSESSMTTSKSSHATQSNKSSSSSSVPAMDKTLFNSLIDDAICKQVALGNAQKTLHSLMRQIEVSKASSEISRDTSSYTDDSGTDSSMNEDDSESSRDSSSDVAVKISMISKAQQEVQTAQRQSTEAIGRLCQFFGAEIH